MRPSISSASRSKRRASRRPGLAAEEADGHAQRARAGERLGAGHDGLEGVGKAVPDLAENGVAAGALALDERRQDAHEAQARVAGGLDVLDDLEGLADGAQREALGLEGEQGEVGAGQGGSGDAAQAGRGVHDHDVERLVAGRERLLERVRPRHLGLERVHVRRVEPSAREQAEPREPRGDDRVGRSRDAREQLGKAGELGVALQGEPDCALRVEVGQQRPPTPLRESHGQVQRDRRPCLRRPSGSRSPRDVPSAPPRCDAKCSTPFERTVPARVRLRRRVASSSASATWPGGRREWRATRR